MLGTAKAACQKSAKILAICTVCIIFKVPVILHDKVKSQRSPGTPRVDKSIMCKTNCSENFSEMAAVGEQQQDEDAAELTFPKVTNFGQHQLI